MNTKKEIENIKIEQNEIRLAVERIKKDFIKFLILSILFLGLMCKISLLSILNK